MPQEHKIMEEDYPILEVNKLKKCFQVKGKLGQAMGKVTAVNDVSFKMIKGETYGLVGESGCGKSTTGRMILRLINPTEGKIFYKNQELTGLPKSKLNFYRKKLQMVFQDPYSSLNPRKRIGSILEEPLKIHNIGKRKERGDLVMEMLEKVGLQSEHYYRYPHEFSGGQRQRIGLARALILNPSVVICDEPVSALDVSIQSQIINLLRKLQEEKDLTYLFIAHDISVVRYISDRIGVMYLGNLVEEAPTDDLFASPLHPYTKALISAIPIPNPSIRQERILLKGENPSPIDPPFGCAFQTRCPYVFEQCKKEIPVRKEVSTKHFVSCHLFS